jgi:hypothetical protein
MFVAEFARTGHWFVSSHINPLHTLPHTPRSSSVVFLLGSDHNFVYILIPPRVQQTASIHPNNILCSLGQKCGKITLCVIKVAALWMILISRTLVVRLRPTSVMDVLSALCVVPSLTGAV